MSGGFNKASGGEFADGLSSGFFNTIVPNTIFGPVAEYDSGLFNTGTYVSGIFNLSLLAPL